MHLTVDGFLVANIKWNFYCKRSGW